MYQQVRRHVLILDIDYIIERQLNSKYSTVIIYFIIFIYFLKIKTANIDA